MHIREPLPHRPSSPALPSRTAAASFPPHPASPLLPCPAIPHRRRLLPSPPRIASSSPSLRSAAASSPHLALPPPPPPPHPASPPPPPCLHSRRSPISASPPRLHSRRSPHAPAPPPPLPSLLDLGRSRHAVTRKAQAIATAVFERGFASAATRNSYDEILTSLAKPGGGTEFGKYYSLPALSDPRVDRLPYSIRILLESAIRNCDEFQVTGKDVEKIIDWENSAPKQVEIPFKPARVLQELSDKAYSMGAASGLIRCRYSV